AGSYDKARPYIDTLKELAHFFLETEKHHQREEEGIFPRLVAHGITEPPEIFKEDHAEFKAKKKDLNEISMNAESKDFKEFLGLVTPIIEFLTKNLEEHIYKEDNILYPMSLETLEKAEWKDVRKKFDIIGYCCFAPADIQKKPRRLP
ncbi:MAG: hemerythrin domain-containing protein, partial [Candidatus Omnitrophota bacterium]